MPAFLSDHLSLVGLPPWLQSYVHAMAFVALVYAGFFLLERVRPVERTNWPSVWLNVRLALLLQAMIMLLGAWLLPALLRGVSVWFPDGTGLIKTATMTQQGLLFVAYLMVYDFFYYWLHRAQHRFAGLWIIHKLHHTETQVNVTTTLRVHWLEEVLKAFFIIFPLSLLFDAPPAAQGWLTGALGLWLFFVHANLKLSFGPLSWLLTSPAAHRIHHSLEPAHADRNFAVIFPLWDIVFGTYLRPAGGRWPRTGVAGEATPRFRDAVVAPLAALIALPAKRKQAG